MKPEVLLHSDECVHNIRNAVVSIKSLGRQLKNDRAIFEQDWILMSVQLIRIEEALYLFAQKDTLWNFIRRKFRAIQTKMV